MLGVGEAQQGGAQQGAALQVEGAGGLGAEVRARGRRPGSQRGGAQIDDCQGSGGRRRRDELDRVAVEEGKARAEDRVAGDEGLEGALQGCAVERAAQAHGPGDIVQRAVVIELVQEP